MPTGDEGEIRLRDVCDGDSAGLIRLIGDVYAEYPGCVLDLEREDLALLSPEGVFDGWWILDREGEVVGCCALGLGGDTAELKKLYLRPEMRGRGLARRLVDVVEARAREAGATVIELWTDTRFQDAHGFYDHLGYARTGRTRDLHDLSNTTEYHFTKRL